MVEPGLYVSRSDDSNFAPKKINGKTSIRYSPSIEFIFVAGREAFQKSKSRVLLIKSTTEARGTEKATRVRAYRPLTLTSCSINPFDFLRPKNQFILLSDYLDYHKPTRPPAVAEFSPLKNYFHFVSDDREINEKCFRTDEIDRVEKVYGFEGVQRPDVVASVLRAGVAKAQIDKPSSPYSGLSAQLYHLTLNPSGPSCLTFAAPLPTYEPSFFSPVNFLFGRYAWAIDEAGRWAPSRTSIVIQGLNDKILKTAIIDWTK